MINGRLNGQYYGWREKNKLKNTIKKVATKPPINLIEEIKKINNAGDKQPGLELVKAALKKLEAHIEKKT